MAAGEQGLPVRLVARQVAIKSKHKLAVTSVEKSAIARVLNGCPNQLMPVR